MFWFPLVSVRHQWSPSCGHRGNGHSDVIVTHHRLSWHCHAPEDYAMLSGASHNGRALDYLWVLITDGRRWESWIWCDHLSAGADAMRLLQCTRVSSSWPGSLLSCQSWCFSKLCYKQSHIPMIYLLFVPIILEFKRRRHTDKQEPNDPFVWELRDACIPPGQPGLALNKRLNLHIINDNGIHTAWDTDDQEMSGAPCVPVLSYQRVIYLCLLILTNAPGIRCTSVALQSPAPSPLVTSGPGQKSAACLQCYSPHCTPGVQVYTHAYGQSWNQNIGM